MVQRTVILLAVVGALALVFLLPRVFDEAGGATGVPPVQLRPPPAPTAERSTPVPPAATPAPASPAPAPPAPVPPAPSGDDDGDDDDGGDD